eukprot:CAMPEP_0179033678 /NCGR_PEP_ID=MMETSP0796-20121207/12224_1 /TAXON_ID=73915 /ORGANISM="Pyrodinium bahamense, Strain pbaha01" /LENGTH=602 /DNA_ID=CAMNT_0020729937 /DNA_START=67 /DNA_END=1873 /DNA_ORIENTATION=+
MSWDLFDESPLVVLQAPPALPRLSEHPQLVSCRGIWPGPAVRTSKRLRCGVPGSSWADGLCENLHSHVEPCVRSLKASDDHYGKVCAKALHAADAAFDANLLVTARNEGSACVDFCLAQLEEGNWSATCWQEANLLGLGYMLASLLLMDAATADRPQSEAAVVSPLDASSHDVSVRKPVAKYAVHGKGLSSMQAAAGPQKDVPIVCSSRLPAKPVSEAESEYIKKAERIPHEESLDEAMECIGRTAIHLFNIAVTICDKALPSDPPRWVHWVGRILQQANAIAHAAWLPRAASQLQSTAVWAIPAELPQRFIGLLKGPLVDSVAFEELTSIEFFSTYFKSARPLKIRGHLRAAAWGALEYFADLRRLHEEFGDRLVPVNLGSPLINHRGVKHWPLGRLLEEHLLPSNATQEAPPPAGTAKDEEKHCAVAYMSQHHLLHQAPELQELLAVPPYTIGRELLPVNLWLGTRGTVTSLHSDPQENILCQVAGYKYFRLYGLDQTDKLYPTMIRAKNANAFGTSPVRVEAPDESAYPAFGGAQFVEGVLEPGDMLFNQRATGTMCALSQRRAPLTSGLSDVKGSARLTKSQAPAKSSMISRVEAVGS